MPAPKFLLDLRMLEEQLPGQSPFHDLDHVRYVKLRLCIDKQVYMVRHDFQRQDRKTVLLRHLIKNPLTVLIHPAGENISAVFGTPDDMVLQGIHISSTIR